MISTLTLVGVAMVGSLFAMDAWNNITFTAGEVKNPSKNLPLSLILGTGMVTVLYLLVNFAYMSVLPISGDRTVQRPWREGSNSPPMGA